MGTQQRPMRADAVRNLARIVDAARSEIAAHGIDVGMDEIARTAGVAVGTLYRHFPTKTDLVSAVVDQYVEAAAADAEASLARTQRGESRPVDEIAGYLARVTQSSAEHAAVKASARSLGVSAHGDPSAATRVANALSELIARGQTAGDIRPQITVDDIFLLLTTAPMHEAAAVRGRWVSLVLPGLTTR